MTANAVNATCTFMGPSSRRGRGGNGSRFKPQLDAENNEISGCEEHLRSYDRAGRGHSEKTCASIGDTMKLEQVEARLLAVPGEEPLVGAPPYPAMMREFLTLRVRTDDGLEGIGITAFGGK